MGAIDRSARDPLKIPFLRGLSPVGKTLAAISTYAVWTGFTWLLEGRIQALLRPEAVVDRLVYTGIANVVVGTILALFLIREFVAAGFVSCSQLGFRRFPGPSSRRW